GIRASYLGISLQERADASYAGDARAPPRLPAGDRRGRFRRCPGERFRWHRRPPAANPGSARPDTDGADRADRARLTDALDVAHPALSALRPVGTTARDERDAAVDPANAGRRDEHGPGVRHAAAEPGARHHAGLRLADPDRHARQLRRIGRVLP